MYEKINTISVFSLWRDSQKHINRTLSSLEALERKHNEIKFSYYFYENDSVDSTKDILKHWLTNRNSRLECENLNFTQEHQVITPSRMQKMAYYRNKMINLGRFLKTDYSIILDSDVIFEDTILEQYFSKLDAETVMYTPNIIQNIKCKYCDCNKYSYYDVAALIDENNARGLCWSHNPFQNIFDRINFEKEKPISVKSAFGGFVFIKSDILNYCNWRTENDCEHILFCEQVKKYGKIKLFPDIKVKVELDEETLKKYG